MDILMIVLAVIGAYVVFVLTSFILMRLLFPKIEVEEGENLKIIKTRSVNPYAPRAIKKQKNLAY